MSRSKAATSVANRNDYIRHKALLYAIAHLQTLPDDGEEFGIMCDMCELVLAEKNIFIMAQILSVRQHTGRNVNLWPLDTAAYSAEQLEQKLEWEPALANCAKLASVLAVHLGVEMSDDPEVLAIVAHMKSGKPLGPFGELLEGVAA